MDGIGISYAYHSTLTMARLSMNVSTRKSNLGRPTKTIRCLSLFGWAMLAFHASARADIISAAAFDALDGQASETIVVAVTDAMTGVAADLNFTFSTNFGVFTEDTRIGIDNAGTNQGPAGANTINEGEILILSVAATNVLVPKGFRITALDFGIATVDLVRPRPSNGSAGYIWTSSAASYTSPFSNTTSNQPPANEIFDETSTFDILGSAYTATFAVDENGDPDVSGYRWVTDSDNVDFNFQAAITAVPEPSSCALMLGVAVMCLNRRRKAS